MIEGFLYVFLAVIFWALPAVLLTTISRTKGSLRISFFRQVGIALVGIPIFFFLPFETNLLLLYWKEILLSAFFGALYLFVTFFGFDYLPVSVSRAYASVSRALISVGIGLFFLSETLSLFQLIGITIIVLGIFSLKPSSFDVTHLKKKNQLYGIGLAILAGFLFTISLLNFKFYAEAMNPVLAAYMLELSIGFVLIFSFLGLTIHKRKLPLISFKDFLLVLFVSPMVLLGTFGAAKGYQLLPFSIVQVILVFVLVASIICSWIFLKEKLTVKQLIVFGFMILGLILLNF